MKYRVEVTARAERDLTAILAWLSERSPQGADTWFTAWLEACSFLTENALAASFAPENPEHEEEIRHWTFKTPKGQRYRILFFIRDDVAFILNVRGTGEQFVSNDDMELPNQ